MSTIYIAGKYESRERLRGVKKALEARGHTVLSSWLDETAERGEVSQAYKERVSIRDLAQIAVVDLFLLDTLDESATGGREVELGWGLGLRFSHDPTLRGVTRIGPARNVFHELILSYPSWEAYLGQDT